jgi:flagellar biosynthesis/type III secretory pathway protein FliH
VLDRELADQRRPGADAIARALALAPRRRPRHRAAAPRRRPRARRPAAGRTGRELVVVADPAVEPGGCVAEAAGRQVDAQVGPALARVAAVLR